MLNTVRLVTFDAVVRTGSLAAAARELGYTQPGVSQQIRALERDLNTTLFVRVGRGLRLSDEGEALASRAGSILKELAAAEQHVDAVSRLRAGRVRVCAFPSANATLIPRALSILRDEHHGLAVELHEAEPPESLDGLASGEYDVVVAFSYSGQPVTAPDCMTIPLLTEPMVLMMRDDHPLARRRQIELADLSEERWIAGCVRCRQEFVESCEAVGFAPRIDITTDDNLAVQSHVVSGLGLAVMPHIIQSFVRHPRLRSRPLLPVRSRIISAALRATDQNSPAIEHLVASLRRASSELSDTIDNP